MINAFYWFAFFAIRYVFYIGILEIFDPQSIPQPVILPRNAFLQVTVTTLAQRRRCNEGQTKAPVI